MSNTNYIVTGGVDNETEFFTGTGWKKISEYNPGERVLQYNNDGTAELVNPLEFIHVENDKPFYLFSGEDFNSCLTGDHEIVYGVSKDENYTTNRISMKEVAKKKGLPKRGYIPLTFKYSGSGTGLENGAELVYLASWIVRYAGEISDSEKCYIVPGDSLETGDLEDIIEFVGQCEEAVCSVFQEKNGMIWIKIYCEELSKLLTPDKDGSTGRFGMFARYTDLIYNLSEEEKLGIPWSAYHYDDVCKWQFTQASRGISAHFCVEEGGLMCDDCWTLRQRNTSYIGKYEEVNKKDKYCLIVPSHMLVLRRDNKIFITSDGSTKIV